MKFVPVVSPVFAILLSGSAGPLEIVTLKVPLRGQEGDWLCWAASAQMVMNFIHPSSNIQQCDEATGAKDDEEGQDKDVNAEENTDKETNCCQIPGVIPSECDITGSPDFQRYQFESVPHPGDLPWKTVKTEIGSHERPFIITWDWKAGGSHNMVAVGYASVFGTPWVIVNDPLPKHKGSMKIISFDNYKGGPSFNHTHGIGYYNIRYNGA